MLTFKLLGQVAITQQGTPLGPFRSAKEPALLIYLAYTEQVHQRDFLADLLWESRSTKQSLANLRTVLTRLRQQVNGALVATRKTLALAPPSQPQVDALILGRALANIGEIDTAEKALIIRNALASYEGEFLADFELDNAPQFNEWVQTTRQFIHHQVLGAYEKLGRYTLGTQNSEESIVIAQRWLAVDALNEAAHTLLIQAHLRAGNVTTAVAHYDYCVERLQAELGIAPPAHMTALIQQARPPRPLPCIPANAVRHNLAAEHDQFFGRQATQQEIHARLDQPWCRLVTLVGQGGIGKTRFATTIARSRLDQYRDGVWLVELVNISPDDDDLAETIAVEIATILDLRLTGSAAPSEQLGRYLQPKQLLLVLDNFEHVLEAGIEVVRKIIQQCEHVQLLVTSREALNIRAEWQVTLTGLSYPTDEDDVMPSEAVDLFLARRAQQQHGLIEETAVPAIRTICHMVAGLPLGIELAAALTRHTPVQQIADQLHEGFDTLTASLRDIPDRHRGLQVVFNMSWLALPADLQIGLARLALFRGGFASTAAEQVAGVDAAQLAALVAKSLVMPAGENGRYRLHPVIQAYAVGQLLATDTARQKHGRYYLALLAEHTAPLQKTAPQKSMAQIEPDIENVRLAWQTGLATQEAGLLAAALTSLSIYYQLRGLAREGEAVMHATLDKAQTWGDAGRGLATRAGLERARFQNRLGQGQLAIHTSTAVLKLAHQLGDRWAVGMVQIWWGEALWRLGEYTAAHNKLQQALQLGHELEDASIVGWCHHQLGIIADIQGNHGQAQEHLQQACAVWQTVEHHQNLSNSLNSLGVVCIHQGDLPQAQKILEQALAVCYELGNQHVQTTLLNNLSLIATELGDYEGAHYYLHHSLQLALVVGDLTRQADIYSNLGRNDLRLGNLHSAQHHLERSLEIAQSIGHQTTVASVQSNLAMVRREQGDVAQAQTLYQSALAIAQQHQLQKIECETLLGLAELLHEQDGPRAKAFSAKAVQLAETLQNPHLLAQSKAVERSLASVTGTV